MDLFFVRRMHIQMFCSCGAPNAELQSRTAVCLSGAHMLFSNRSTCAKDFLSRLWIASCEASLKTLAKRTPHPEEQLEAERGEL